MNMNTEYPVEEVDWTRESKKFLEWDPSKSLLKTIRIYQKYSKNKGLFCYFIKIYAVLSHRFWSIVTGADIPLNSSIGGGLLMPHPNGIVIHPHAIIGPNCLIFQQVTVGAVNDGIPYIGTHVDIGAGAKIIGAVKVGDFAKIGANAVVICDVPAGKTAVGVPAKVIF